MSNNAEGIVAAVVETAPIIRHGLVALLKKQANPRLTPVEVVSIPALEHCIETLHPELVFVNPLFGGWFDVDTYKAKYPQVLFVALLSNMTAAEKLKSYDAEITIFEDAESIGEKIVGLRKPEPVMAFPGGTESLSQREKEILICLVKGMSNKEIAEHLYLSVNTITTHRRNINRKLDIHTVAGLTIYAIMNKLVDLKDVDL